MSLEVRCPACDRLLRVPDDLAGARVQCPACRETFTAQADAPRPRPPDREDPEPPPRPRESFRRDDDRPEPPRPLRRERDWEDDYYPRRARGGVAAEQVNGPAIGLMVAAGLGIASALVQVVLQLLGVPLFNFPGQAPPQNEAERTLQMVGAACGGLLTVLWSAFTLFGALRMKGLQNYGLAMAASIMSMVPCHGCCLLGLPFGIWSLVVLSKSEVKDAFT